MIKAIELKKGDKVKTNQLGLETSGVLLESPKQGRGLKQTILVDCKGSEVGLFDEAGSVYINQVKKVLRNDTWIEVVV
jgi:hypothetical protein